VLECLHNESQCLIESVLMPCRQHPSMAETLILTCLERELIMHCITILNSHNILSIATSTTSAPAAAQASMLAVAIPAVS
jgi:hypothetical protein